MAPDPVDVFTAFCKHLWSTYRRPIIIALLFAAVVVGVAISL